MTSSTAFRLTSAGPLCRRPRSTWRSAWPFAAGMFSLSYSAGHLLTRLPLRSLPLIAQLHCLAFLFGCVSSSKALGDSRVFRTTSEPSHPLELNIALLDFDTPVPPMPSPLVAHHAKRSRAGAASHSLTSSLRAKPVGSPGTGAKMAPLDVAITHFFEDVCNSEAFLIFENFTKNWGPLSLHLRPES